MSTFKKKNLKCKKLCVKKKLYLKNIDLTNDILKLITTNKDVDTLKKQQFFTENTDGDIYTLKNIIVGSDKNIDTTNIYSKSISLNRVSKSITMYYDSILNVNTIVNYILNNVDLIRQNGFENVLRPFVENMYYENNHYFGISTCPNSNDTELLKNSKYLFTWKEYENYTGLTAGDLCTLNSQGQNIYFNNEGTVVIDINRQVYNYFKIYENLGLNQKNYFNSLITWDNGINLSYKCILNIPGILPVIPGVNPDYIVVNSFVKLNKVIEDIDQIQLFSPEYVKFINKLSNNMSTIHGIYNNLKTNIFTSSIQYDVWEYNTASPLSSVCFYSSQYSSIIGKKAIDSIIIDSDINIPNMLTYVINFNSKNLLLSNDGEAGVIEYNYSNLNYTILTKIIILNGKKYLIVNTILINPFFNNAIQTNGNVVVEGSLSVNNTDGMNILKLNTNTSVLEVNGEIGINTKTPQALLDIKSISIVEIKVITDKYAELNNFIFNYYDHFIDNFSITQNRNWNTIYNNFFDKSKISITTITLPFNFKTTTSSDSLFSDFINDFNNRVSFDYTEEEFKLQFQGKKASEIQNTYFDKYFYSLKEYFLIVWNQKDYYLLNGYQTFTNIVNYFGGPVLRMQVMWYDENCNSMRLFSSNLRLDNYLSNNKLNLILSEYFNSLFACEQLINIFSNLLKDPIIQQKQMEDKLYLTNYVKNSYYKGRFGYPQNYVFCSDYLDDNVNDVKYLFHESNTYWSECLISKISVPGQDILVSSSVGQTLKYLKDNFGTPIKDRIRISFYFWSAEYKVAYMKIIEVTGLDGVTRNYRIGSGINILEYVKKNILSNGDQQFNGSLRLIEPVSNQTVVMMDTTEKQMSIQYPLGLGTEKPRSILTIDDVSITNLFDYLDEVSRKNRYTNDLSKQLSSSTTLDFKSIIENYIDPFTGTLFQQNIDNYFGIIKYDINNIFTDFYSSIMSMYSWHLKLWGGKTLKYIINDSSFDKINNGVKLLVKNIEDTHFKIGIMYPGVSSILVANFIWGKKYITSKQFLNNNILYRLYTGINFNAYFTRMNTNKNLNNIISAIQNIQAYLNNLYLTKNNLSPVNTIELQPFIDKVKEASNNFKLWVMDFPTNINDTRLYLTQSGSFPTNLDDLHSTDTIYNMLYNFNISNHGNLTYEEIILFYQKIINLRQKINHYNGNTLVEQDSNLVGYRTDEDYWVAAWIYMSIQTSSGVKNVVTVCEINVDDYLNQSIQMIGDLQMAGNLTLMNPREYFKYVRDKVSLSSLNPLVSIYPEEGFIGLGSQKIFTQYVLNYNTIDLQTNNVFAKNHVVVSNPYYPNLVGERIADPSQSLTRDDSIKSSYSGFTVRRKTKTFTLEDIVRDGDGKFGIDISYEVEDKYEDAYEIAESGVSITGLKTFTNGIKYPVPKYFWNIVNDATDKNTVEKKTIMELDSEGRLTVSKIKLGNFYLEAVDNNNGTQSLKWGSVTLGTQYC